MLKSTRLRNGSLNIELLNYGARIASIYYRDQPVTLSYSNHQDFLADNYFLGASVGPIANRIAGGRLEVSGKQYQMPQNEFHNSLHSGGIGFDKLYWQQSRKNQESIEYHCLFDMTTIGLEGLLSCKALYQLDGDSLRVRYQSSCTADTYINITNHVYFNLDGCEDIRDHRYKIYAHSMREHGADKLPNKERRVFSKPSELALSASEFSEGIDHHFDMNNNDGAIQSEGQLRNYASVSSNNGLTLTVRGNAPGFQLYTGAGLAAPFLPFSGFCIEPQYAPDAINSEHDYSPILKADTLLERTIEYAFKKMD